MKTMILTLMLMFTLITTGFSGGDATAVAVAPTPAAVVLDQLKPIVPTTATFDDSVPLDTAKLIKE